MGSAYGYSLVYSLMALEHVRFRLIADILIQLSKKPSHGLKLLATRTAF
mgnify:FL=1